MVGPCVSPHQAKGDFTARKKKVKGAWPLWLVQGHFFRDRAHTSNATPTKNHWISPNEATTIMVASTGISFAARESGRLIKYNMRMPGPCPAPARTIPNKTARQKKITERRIVYFIILSVSANLVFSILLPNHSHQSLSNNHLPVTEEIGTGRLFRLAQVNLEIQKGRSKRGHALPFTLLRARPTCLLR